MPSNKAHKPSPASKTWAIKRRRKQVTMYQDWELPKPSKAAVKRAEAAGRKLARRNTDPEKPWPSWRNYPVPKDLL